MIPEAQLISGPDATPSKAGFTTKVVKGSLWTLVGQVLPLGVALFTTPFVIRLLGAESYGVLVLIALIPTYLGFADLGMGIASTRFGSDAYASGDLKYEARVLHTAALIALLAAFPIAALLFFFSDLIVGSFNVPNTLLAEAGLALKIASVTFVINFLNNIFNTPQLARLRMDLNTLVTAGFRTAGIIATPVVIYLGGGVLGAVLVLLTASVLTLAGHLIVSKRLLSSLFATSLDQTMIRPLLKFGGALVISSIAALLLGSAEKLIVARITSPKELAYYSVAFTLAMVMTLFSGSMTQSLIPAFAQLQGPDDRARLNGLYARCIRITLIVFLPAVVFFGMIAKSFLTLWAGPDFGREGAVPLYVILAGLLFNAVAYFPCAMILASGRPDILAKIYWLELLLYIPVVIFLVSRYGITGAAIAWSIRGTCDSLILFVCAHRATGVSAGSFDWQVGLSAFLLITTPFLLTLYYAEVNIVIAASALIAFSLYGLIVWKRFLDREETDWLRARIYGFFPG